MYPATNARGRAVVLCGVHQVWVGGEHSIHALPYRLEVQLDEVVLGAGTLGDRANVGRSGAQAEVAEIGVEVPCSDLCSGLYRELYVDREVGHF